MSACCTHLFFAICIIYFSHKIGAAIYSSDDDESDIDTRRGKKTDKSKALRALADSDEESVSGSNHGGKTSNDDAEEDEAVSP